jgi:hypothetical protein
MDNDNIYDKIQEMFGYFPSHFNILEDQIDIDLQMEYFEHSKNFKDKIDEADTISKKDDLFENDTSLEDKKELFVKLASIENVEAYRVIEKYLQQQKPDDLLKDWALLALQESRMLLESKLLDTNQIFISTGLGGKGSKLRYFVVLVQKNMESLTDLNKRIISSELEDTLKKYQSEIESIDFKGPYASLFAVVPMNVSIKELFNNAIFECNQFGEFLRDNFIITNVKELSYDEINDFINNSEEEEN